MLLKFIELKSGYNDNGPAWIGYVIASKSGRTFYFNGKAFKQFNGGRFASHLDIETQDEYWISSVKKDGQDRHWAGSGKITIEAAAVDEYLKTVGLGKLDSTKFVVSNSIKRTDPTKFHEMENQKLEQ